MPKALAHRLALANKLDPKGVPHHPPTRQLAVHHVAQRLRHRVVSLTEDPIAPSAEAQRNLAVHQHAQALAKLLHERRAIRSHLHPCGPTAGKLTVQEVAEALAHRLALRLLLRPHLMPAHPTARQLAVHHVAQRLRHRVVTLTKHSLTPGSEAERHLAVHKHAQTLAHLLHERRVLRSHLHPSTEALRKLPVEHMHQAPLH